MSATRDVLAELRRLDPATRWRDQPLDSRAEADLQTILRVRGVEDPPVRRAGRRRRPVLVLAAAAVLAVLVAVPGLPGSVLGRGDLAHAATPSLLPFELASGGPAASALEALEQRAAHAQKTPTAAGGHVVRTESWSLSSRVDNGETVTSAVVSELRELRWNPDRSGSLHVVTGDPQFPGEQYRRAWDQAGRPAAAGTVVTGETYGPGQFTPMYPFTLPRDPARLLAQLSVGHPISEYGTVELVVAVRDLYLEQTPPPAVRAAVLALLRQRRDIVFLGSVTDRAGRAGLAFAMDSDYSGLPTRYVLVFDPASGRLLATEEVLTTRAGKLKVTTPSVIGYTTFLAGS